MEKAGCLACFAAAAILSPTLRKQGGTPCTNSVLSRGRCCTASDSLITCTPAQHLPQSLCMIDIPETSLSGTLNYEFLGAMLSLFCGDVLFLTVTASVEGSSGDTGATAGEEGSCCTEHWGSQGRMG